MDCRFFYARFSKKIGWVKKKVPFSCTCQKFVVPLQPAKVWAKKMVQ